MPILVATPPGLADRDESAWDESPQGAGIIKMHVCIPECNSWLYIDIKRQDNTAFANAAEFASKRVSIYDVKAELEARLSIFRDKEIMIYKCTAEQANGPALSDDDTVYYLTWLIAWTSSNDPQKNLAAAKGVADAGLVWQYQAPVDTTANLIGVLVYIEQCNVWEEVFVPDYGAITNGMSFTTVGDLTHIIMASFKLIEVEGFTLEMDMSMLEIKRCQGSHPKGEKLTDNSLLWHGKWYYVTAEKLVAEMKKIGDLADAQ